MKKNRDADLLIEQLRKIPIVQVACEKLNLSRNSVYRWRKEDAEFAKAMDEALAEGEAIVNDLGESQLITLMKEKNWNAIAFWLRKRNPRFRDRLEVVAGSGPQEELSPEQEAVVKEALRLASLTVETPPETKVPSPQEPKPGEDPTNDNPPNHEPTT